MSLLLEIADAIREPPSDILEPLSCEGCASHINGSCTLWSGDCVNSPDKPYWRPIVVAQQLEVAREEAL